MDEEPPRAPFPASWSKQKHMEKLGEEMGSPAGSAIGPGNVVMAIAESPFTMEPGC